jgi:hypothetical protein
MFETMRRLHSRGPAGRGIVVDREGAMVGPDCILVRHTARGYRCLARDAAAQLQDFLLGDGSEPDWLFRQCRRIAEALDKDEIALAQILGLRIPIGDLEAGRLKRLALAAPVLKAGFDPDEPRLPGGQPGGGEWTSAGGASGDDASGSGDKDDTTPSVVGMTVAGEAAAGSLLGDIDGGTLAALGRLAGGMAGPTAFLGTLFIPFNGSPVAEGGFAGLPGLRYRYDQDTGTLTLSQEDMAGDLQVLANGHIDADGFFRDDAGRAIGRALPGGGVIVDPDTLSGYRSGADADRSSNSATAAQTDAQTDNEPKLCPDPGPDHPGPRSKDIQYQQYVSEFVNGWPLEAGLAVNLLNPVSGKYVNFDDCRLSDGTMIDAKGTGYAAMLRNAIVGASLDLKFIDQATKQLEAAGGRPIEWYFAEQDAATYVRALFAKTGLRISVFYLPPPWTMR